MTYKITDLIAPTGQEIDSILLTVTSIGGIETVNAPTEGLSVTIGMVPGIGDNRAGRFGWVSFGKTYLGVQFWSQRQDVNYINQIFYSNIESGSAAAWFFERVRKQTISRSSAIVAAAVVGCTAGALAWT